VFLSDKLSAVSYQLSAKDRELSLVFTFPFPQLPVAALRAERGKSLGLTSVKIGCR
jgi:hypothetical protein